MNIVIPMTGPNRFDGDDFAYPTPIIDLSGRIILDRSLDAYRDIKSGTKFIPIFLAEDAREFKLDYVVRQLLPADKLDLIVLDNPTQGALCTALMAIDRIDNDTPLIITSGDHIIDGDISEILNGFEQKSVDFGVIGFDAVHPKWSFVRLDDRGYIVESAEKRPISRNAIAGFYYFRKGSDFVIGAKRVLKKGASVSGKYYVSGVLNELVLLSKRGAMAKIDASRYTNFYDPAEVKAYASRIGNSHKAEAPEIKELARRYQHALLSGNLTELENIFHPDLIVKNSIFLDVKSKIEYLKIVKDLCSPESRKGIQSKTIGVDGAISMSEISVALGDTLYEGLERQTWSASRIVSIESYLVRRP